MKALLICLLCASVAYADPASDEQAHAHFRQGRAYVEAKVYDKAIEEFQAAYKLAPLPDLIFNIAQAYRLAGDPDRSLAAYKQYLAAQSQGEEADESRAHVAELTKIITTRNAQNAATDAEQRRQAQLAMQQDQALRGSVEDVRRDHAHARTIGWVVTIVSLVATIGGFYAMGSGISGAGDSSTMGVPTNDNVGEILLGALAGTFGLTGAAIGIAVIVSNPDPGPLPPMSAGMTAPGTVHGPSLSWTF
jgi:hypothetical protein